MGLLDTPKDAAMMQMAMGLLSAGGPSRTPVSLGQAFGDSGQQAMQAYRQREGDLQRKQAADMQMQAMQMQIEEARRKQALQEAIRGAAKESYLSPQQQAIGAGGPTPEAAAMIPNLKPKFDQKSFISKLYGVDPLTAMDMNAKLTPSPIKLGKDDTLLEPGTYKELARGKGGSELKEGYLVPDGQGGWKVDPVLYQAAQDMKRAGAGNTNIVNNTKDNFKNERDLRNDFQGLPTTKAFREVQSAHDQIKTALAIASPASDLAAATKIMKILDPGSVVRESELGMAMQASGLMDRMNNYVQMTMSGQKLTPEQRKDFGKLADELYAAAESRYNQSVEEYQGTAKDYGLNATRVAKPAKKSSVSPGGWSAAVVK